MGQWGWFPLAHFAVKQEVKAFDCDVEEPYVIKGEKSLETALLTEDQIAIRDTVRAFMEKEVKPVMGQYDASGEFPVELYQKAFDMGLHVLNIPEEFGGAGLDHCTMAVALEEMGRVDPGFAITMLSTAVTLQDVLVGGTDEQKQQLTALVQDKMDKEMEKKLQAMFEEIGFEGVFEVEFLIDKDGTFYFMETNFRASAWNPTCKFAGMPLDYLWVKGMENGYIDPADRNAPTVLAGKKFTLTGAGGKAATAGCRKLLTTLLTVLKADVMTEGQTGIALNLEAWTEGRMILTEEQKTQLASQAERFLEFIK